MKKEIEKLVILKRTNPDIFEVHVNSIDRINNLLFSTRNEKLATGIVNGYNSLLTPSADVQERAKGMQWVKASERLPKRYSYTIFRQISTRVVLSESMAKDWVEDGDLCNLEWLDESGASSLQAENERLKRLLHDLTPGGSEFYNDPERCAKWIRESRDEAHYSMAVMIKKLKDENEQLKALNKQ